MWYDKQTIQGKEIVGLLSLNRKDNIYYLYYFIILQLLFDDTRVQDVLLMPSLHASIHH